MADAAEHGLDAAGAPPEREPTESAALPTDVTVSAMSGGLPAAGDVLGHRDRDAEMPADPGGTPDPADNRTSTI